MKKLTALLLVLMLIFTSCGTEPVICEHADINDDGVCEFCGEELGGTADPNCSHTDSDDDGVCDGCNGSVIVVVDLYAINDLHGKLDDSDSDIGVDELTAYLKRMSALDEYSLFLSSGDMWQGTATSNLTDGLIITDWMNELGFVSMTLGNHEYDWGEETVMKNAEAAEFPLLGINIYDRDTNERVEYCDASVTVDLGKIQVGIIGAMGDCYSSISSDKVEDIYFKTGSELTELVTSEAQRLRESGVDLIVYSIHDGHSKSSTGTKEVSATLLSSYYSPSLSRGVVDVVFEAHTHRSYVLLDTYGVYHLQGGGDNDGLSHAELAVNYVTGTVATSVAEFVNEARYENLDGDEIIESLLDKYADEIAVGEVICGTNSVTRDSTYIKNLVARLYYEYGVEKWGEEYDIAIGGGYISTRSPYDLAAGEVKYAELASLLPFDNEVLLCSVSGRDLLSRFINTSNDNYYVYPNSVSSIDPNATYYIVTDSYCAQYAPNRLTVVESLGADIYARDLVAEYIKEGGLE